MIKNILITGGTGFIGSHTCVELINNGYNLIIIDNLSNSKENIIDAIISITNKKEQILFYKIDMLNKNDLENIFSKYSIDSVFHFAGLKAVGESVKNPLMYYNVNLTITLNLLELMTKYGCKKLIYSSSATVYGNKLTPFHEKDVSLPLQPYGKTKYFIEEILKDLYISDNSWSIVILRYFNPGGSHQSGLLQENPNNIPNNLLPYMIDVANKKLPYLTIYGDNYNTPDGTCIRDYIHVVDLAMGHVACIKKLFETGINIYNLGTGKGTSVLELVHAFIRVNNLTDFKYIIGKRREGDAEVLVANVDKVYEELGWKALKNIEDICKN
jgi:UDP-glucose 4-epimerase